mgnify:CR=1 FL=1
MVPLQEINIKTKKSRIFAVHLEKLSEDSFECKLAAINLGPTLHGDETLGPFSKGTTADLAFRNLISKLKSWLSEMDPNDAIDSIDNPCNTEFLEAEQQCKALDSNTSIKVNGRVV